VSPFKLLLLLLLTHPTDISCNTPDTVSELMLVVLMVMEAVRCKIRNDEDSAAFSAMIVRE
jgi:hypothetical protein